MNLLSLIYFLNKIFCKFHSPMLFLILAQSSMEKEKFKILFVKIILLISLRKRLNVIYIKDDVNHRMV
jgi:hypothetical protein